MISRKITDKDFTYTSYHFKSLNESKPKLLSKVFGFLSNIKIPK